MNFLKTLIASTLGIFLAFFIICVIIFLILFVGHGSHEPHVADNSILQMNISGKLPARSVHNHLEDLFNPAEEKTVSLETLKNNLQKAAADDKIKGVLLDIGHVDGGWANLQEAYQNITQFRDTTYKFIYATTNDEGLNEKGYYLASAADSVFVPPQSPFEFDGFYTSITFYKGLLKKLKIKTAIARHGKYKSAVEPFFRKDLSKPARYQLSQILDEASHTFLSAASRKSGKSIQQLNAMLNEAPHLSAAFGYKQGLIDSLLYANQLDSLIKRRIGLTKDQSLHTISGVRFAKVSRESAGIHTSKAEGTIGVIYAGGIIKAGRGNINPLGKRHIITAPWFKKQLQKVTDNSTIKALVIRINSPGGSGSASDVIWNMIRQTGKKMPVIVSMGPVAASGGYYIAVAADTIVAEPTTITGSIGVFGLKFNAKQFFNDKLGITFDGVKTNKHSDWMSPTRSFTPSEREAFEKYTTLFYNTFLDKVAQGRGLEEAQVQKIAQGRVWTGRDAKEYQLVDVLGGMDKALEIAADAAGLKHYRTEAYPKQENFLQSLINATTSKVHSIVGKVFFSGEIRKIHRQAAILQKGGAMFLLPYKIDIE
jgi:protease-4